MTLEIPSVKDQVSSEEWQLRCDLAACYRLVAAYGWSDLVFTHISVRIPGPEHHFLINPYGLMFDEITASSFNYTQPTRQRQPERSPRALTADYRFMARSRGPPWKRTTREAPASQNVSDLRRHS